MLTVLTVHRRSGNANTSTPRAKWVKQRSHASAPNDETRYDQQCPKSWVNLAADALTRDGTLAEQKCVRQGCFVWVKKSYTTSAGAFAIWDLPWSVQEHGPEHTIEAGWRGFGHFHVLIIPHISLAINGKEWDFFACSISKHA